MGLFDGLANRAGPFVRFVRDPKARESFATTLARMTHRTFREPTPGPFGKPVTIAGRRFSYGQNYYYMLDGKIVNPFSTLRLQDSGDADVLKLTEWKGQRFTAHATDWEKKHCLPIGKRKGFTPVVDSNGTLTSWLVSAPASAFRVRLTDSWLEEREYSLASFRRGEQARYSGDTFLAWINWLGWPPPGPRRQKLIEVGVWKRIEGLDDYWVEVPGWVDAAPFESGLSILYDPDGSVDSTQYLQLFRQYSIDLAAVCDTDGQVQLILDTYPTSQGNTVESWADPGLFLGAAGLAKGLFRLLRSGLSKSGVKTLFAKRGNDTIRAVRRTRGLREGDLVKIPRSRGASRVLTNEEMEALLRETLRQRPYLARLGPARGLNGPALNEEILRILRQWEISTGKRHLRVTDNTVRRLGSQGKGGWALDSLSGKEVLIIEEQVFKNSGKLLDEVTHELAYDAVREGIQGVPKLPVDLDWGRSFANYWLEAVIKGGDDAWDTLRAVGRKRR